MNNNTANNMNAITTKPIIHTQVIENTRPKTKLSTPNKMNPPNINPILAICAFLSGIKNPKNIHKNCSPKTPKAIPHNQTNDKPIPKPNPNIPSADKVRSIPVLNPQLLNMLIFIRVLVLLLILQQ
jgi:hypothetical protein